MSHVETLLTTFEALTEEERPPRWSWHMGEVFGEFVHEVFEARRRKAKGEDTDEDEMYDADPDDLTPGMRAAMKVDQVARRRRSKG